MSEDASFRDWWATRLPIPSAWSAASESNALTLDLQSSRSPFAVAAPGDQQFGGPGET